MRDIQMERLHNMLVTTQSRLERLEQQYNNLIEVNEQLREYLKKLLKEGE